MIFINNSKNVLITTEHLLKTIVRREYINELTCL
jgi:hypothetical protein